MFADEIVKPTCDFDDVQTQWAKNQESFPEQCKTLKHVHT